MNIDAKAREIALRLFDAYDPKEAERVQPATDAIAAAILAVRNEAMEDAAGVLLREAKDLKDGPGYWDDEIQDYERLANAIRALKEGT